MSLLKTIDFTNKKVLISGASNGIWYGIAQAFLAEGAEVHITGTRAKENYNNDFSDLIFHPLNVQSETAINDLAAKFDSLDVLINCVGAAAYDGSEFQRAKFETLLTINLTGVMHLCMGN